MNAPVTNKPMKGDDQYQSSSGLIKALRPLLKRVRTSDSAIKIQKSNGKKRAAWTSQPLLLSDGTPTPAMLKHFNSGPVRGTALMQYDSTVTLVGVYDLDDHDKDMIWDEMLAVAYRLMEVMRSFGLVPVPFRSLGGRGIHIYCIWAEPQDAYTVRVTMALILNRIEFTVGTRGVQHHEIEIFPKRDFMRPRTVTTKKGRTRINRGNQVFLPLGGKSMPLDPVTLADLPKGPGSIKWLESKPLVKLEKVERTRPAGQETVELATLRSAVDAIPNSDEDELSWDDWFKMVAAIHYATEGSDEGYDIAWELSARSDRHNRQSDSDFDDAWDGCDDDHPHPATAGSIFAEAMKHGWKMPEPDPVNIDEVFQDESGEDPEPSVCNEPLMPVEGGPSWPGIELPGVTGELAAWIEHEAPQCIPQFAAAAALITIAALSGGQYIILGTRTPLNLYLFLLAETGTGKDHYLSIPAEVLSQVSGGSNRCSVISRAVSGPGIIQRLSKNRALLLAQDEVGHLLGSARNANNPHGQGLESEVMQLYGHGAKMHHGASYADSSKDVPPIAGPFFNIIGATTPAKMWDVMKKAHVEEGLLNRVLVIPAVEPDDNYDDRDLALPEGLKARLAGIGTFEELPTNHVGDVQLWLLPITDPARYFWKQKRKEQKGRGPLWSRSAENMLRVAGLIALADGRKIETSDMEVAWRFIEWSINQTVEAVKERSFESVHDEITKKVIRLIKDGKTGIAKWKKMCRPGVVPKALIYHMLHGKEPRHVDNAIEALVKGELIREDNTNKKSPTLVWIGD